jgi:L-ascorbate metabolism protein UlaG (beta-lactamase superfamily)
VVTFGPFTVYHSGDTLWYEGLTAWLAPWTPDVALLPINGNRPERRVAGNLDGREAALLAHTIGAGLVIPGHYDLFTFNTARPEEAFVPECERLGQPYAVLSLGERWSKG